MATAQETWKPRANRRPGDEKRKPVGPNPYLTGEFLPVGESPDGRWQPVGSVVEGAIPADLCGTFLRNGPNPEFDFEGKPYHFFDGDGMIHAVRFENGKAEYLNRWIQTKRLQAQRQNGFAFAEFAEVASVEVEPGKMPTFYHSKYDKDEKKEYRSPANTAFAFQAGELLALNEADKPYRIDPDDLSTKGRMEWNVKHGCTAHPRVCPKTGEMFFFNYVPASKEDKWLYCGVLNPKGELERSFPVAIPHPVMMHDCILTENYMVLFDLNLRFDLMELIKEMQTGKPTEGPWRHHLELPARFGFLPRTATSDKDVKWIEIPPCGVFHFCNAWEEGDEVVVVGSRFHILHLDAFSDKAAESLNNKENEGRMTMWRLNLRTGKMVSEQKLSDHPVDFSQIDWSTVGRESKIVYAAEFAQDKDFGFRGMVKYNLKTSEVQTYRHPEGHVGGEVVFARRKGGSAAEDDGYLMGMVINRNEGSTECAIVDAQTMKLVARVKMPSRVPQGFHAFWLGAEMRQPRAKL